MRPELLVENLLCIANNQFISHPPSRLCGQHAQQLIKLLERQKVRCLLYWPNLYGETWLSKQADQEEEEEMKQK